MLGTKPNLCSLGTEMWLWGGQRCTGVAMGAHGQSRGVCRARRGWGMCRDSALLCGRQHRAELYRCGVWLQLSVSC